MTKEQGAVGAFLTEKRDETLKRMRHGALIAAYPTVVAGEGVAAVTGVMETGWYYAPHRILAKGLIEALLQHNGAEISQAAERLVSTVASHPEGLLPIVSLAAIAGAGELLRRNIRTRLQK